MPLPRERQSDAAAEDGEEGEDAERVDEGLVEFGALRVEVGFEVVVAAEVRRRGSLSLHCWEVNAWVVGLCTKGEDCR